MYQNGDFVDVNGKLCVVSDTETYGVCGCTVLAAKDDIYKGRYEIYRFESEFPLVNPVKFIKEHPGYRLRKHIRRHLAKYRKGSESVADVKVGDIIRLKGGETHYKVQAVTEVDAYYAPLSQNCYSGLSFDRREIEVVRENERHFVRELEEMPFDKVFTTANGNEELCRATGLEVCLGNPEDLSDWWNEYVDSNGDLYYGR